MSKKGLPNWPRPEARIDLGKPYEEDPHMSEFRGPGTDTEERNKWIKAKDERMSGYALRMEEAKKQRQQKRQQERQQERREQRQHEQQSRRILPEPIQSTSNPYTILGLTPGATKDEIKSAYKAKARELHPDKNKTPTATSEFQKLSSAYKTIQEEDFPGQAFGILKKKKSIKRKRNSIKKKKSIKRKRKSLRKNRK